MTLRRIAFWLLGVIAVLSFSVALVLTVTGTARAAPTREFTLSFPELRHGIPATDRESFTLDRVAALTSFEWIERNGVMEHAVLTAEVCDPAGTCVDPTALGRRVSFAPGTVSVTVTVELTAAAGSGESGSAVGRLTFTGDDSPVGGLPPTGADVLPWLLWGAATVAIGTLLLALGRRRGPGTSGGEVRVRE